MPEQCKSSGTTCSAPPPLRMHATYTKPPLEQTRLLVKIHRTSMHKSFSEKWSFKRACALPCLLVEVWIVEKDTCPGNPHGPSRARVTITTQNQVTNQLRAGWPHLNRSKSELLQNPWHNGQKVAPKRTTKNSTHWSCGCPGSRLKGQKGIPHI